MSHRPIGTLVGSLVLLAVLANTAPAAPAGPASAGPAGAPQRGLTGPPAALARETVVAPPPLRRPPAVKAGNRPRKANKQPGHLPGRRRPGR